MIEKKIDKLGRVVLPKGYRDKLGLKCCDKVLICLEKSSICISSNKSACALCGKQLDGDPELRLCELCISKVKNS